MTNTEISRETSRGAANPARFRPIDLVPGQHALQPSRNLRAALPEKPPKILLAILAKQKEISLPLYLRCIEALDYPKSSIVVYIRTNNNRDRTAEILAEWAERVRGQYAGIEIDASDVAAKVEDFGVHEWNATRFGVLAKIRTDSLRKALDYGCDFYFTADVDNFVRPCTLKELVALNLPIVAPMLRSVDPRALYLNCHVDIDDNGYYRDCDQYGLIFAQKVVGVFELPVVHCTYLIRAACIPELAYADGSARHEYVIFSDVARKAGIPQYYDNRQVYGYLTLSEEAEAATKLIGPEIGAAISARRAAARPNLFACLGLHSSGSTWMFNLVREICLSQGIDFVSLHRNLESNLPWDVYGNRLIVAKTHNPFPSFQDFIAKSSEAAVITVRDPRDAVVSFMQRFPNSLATNFDQALEAIRLSAESLVSMQRQRKLPVFRYEDGFVGSNGAFEEVAALLGVSPNEDARRSILLKLSAESVKRKIGELEAAGGIQGESVWDKETHWHLNHVGDGKIGKFHDILDETQVMRVEDETREFCELFGYQTSPAGRTAAVAEDVTALPRPAYAGNGRQKIGLSMIVKNEARSIRRCLQSVLPIVDYWAIVDTGSTDGTQDIIREFLAGVPGELKESPWVDFSDNRNEALELARPHCDYVFFIDADDILELPPKFAMPILSATSYFLEIRQKELHYWRPHLLRSDLPWRFEGVLHEFLTCGADKTGQRIFAETRNPQRLAKATIHMTDSGARRQVAAQERFARDASLLEKALETETDPFLVARYTFYLAQSHRDAGNKAAALTAYLARAKLGYWEQEVYISLYHAAVLEEELGHGPEEVIEAYRRAHTVDPRRAEALHGAARFCRLHGRFQEGYDFAKRALKLTAPETGLFVQQWVYDYGILDEYAVCAYWIGRYEDCLKASRRIFAGSAVPDAERPRVRANIDHALEKMREKQRSAV